MDACGMRVAGGRRSARETTRRWLMQRGRHVRVEVLFVHTAHMSWPLFCLEA